MMICSSPSGGLLLLLRLLVVLSGWLGIVDLRSVQEGENERMAAGPLHPIDFNLRGSIAFNDDFNLFHGYPSCISQVNATIGIGLLLNTESLLNTEPLLLEGDATFHVLSQGVLLAQLRGVLTDLLHEPMAPSPEVVSHLVARLSIRPGYQADLVGFGVILHGDGMFALAVILGFDPLFECGGLSSL
jgi:hypothetical protein